MAEATEPQDCCVRFSLGQPPWSLRKGVPSHCCVSPAPRAEGQDSQVWHQPGGLLSLQLALTLAGLGLSLFCSLRCWIVWFPLLLLWFFFMTWFIGFSLLWREHILINFQSCLQTQRWVERRGSRGTRDLCLYRHRSFWILPASIEHGWRWRGDREIGKGGRHWWSPRVNNKSPRVITFEKWSHTN